MSGHSKWATTKRKKAAIDAKRGKIFTRIAKLITIAARDGGGNPESNASLRMAIDNAKAQSLPKENIERAIQKGIGGGTGSNIEEISYEAYGPGGVGIIIECLTDNKNRTISEVKAALNKRGGTMASQGSVSFNFQKRGEIIIDESKNDIKGEELEMVIIEAGALDFEKDENIYVVYTDFKDLNKVKVALETENIVLDSIESTMYPTGKIDIPEEKADSLNNLLDALDELDDVNKVYANVAQLIGSYEVTNLAKIRNLVIWLFRNFVGGG